MFIVHAIGARVILEGKDAEAAGIPSERLCAIQVMIEVVGMTNEGEW